MTFDVVIVGSGLVGASLALALGDIGLNLGIVESQPPQPTAANDWDSRIYAISPGSAAFLENCGVWHVLDSARVNQVEEMRIFGDNVNSQLDFSAYDAGLRELAFIVENRGLQHALWHAMQEHSGIELISPAECKTLTMAGDSAQLELSNGRILCAQLIVGADGANSWVRAQTGIDIRTHDYRQTAVVANFGVSKPHHDIAFQWFRRDGVLAFLPLPGNRVSMVWSTAADHAAQLTSLPDVEFAARVTEAGGGKVGDMEVITSAASFPLRLQRVARLVQPRIALIGDAAHTVHPLAGQGVNLGFRDARELARVLMQRGAQTDCGDYRLLRRYERARQEDLLTMRFATDSLQRLFNNENQWLAGLRNFGMRLTNTQPHLKNLLVQHAVG